MPARKIRGAWWVDFRYEGKRYRRKSPVTNKRGAERYEHILRDRLIRGEPMDGREADKEEQTYESFAADYLKTYVAVNNERSTARTKEINLNAHIVPFFAGTPLGGIGVREIEEFKAGLVGKGLAPKTINNILSILRNSLTTAVKWQLLESCPAFQWMDVPEPPFDFFSVEESNRVLAAASGQDRAMICTAVKAGLRRGELLALRQEDIDLVARRIDVRQAVSRGHITTPKNGKTRHVPMSPQLRDVLAGHRHLRGPYVFCNEDGSMLTKDQVRRTVQKACQKAGLRAAGWHMLRHTFASQLAMAGVPLRVIQELLGHSTIKMTLRYAHLSPSTLVDAVSVLDSGGRWTRNGHSVGTGSGERS